MPNVLVEEKDRTTIVTLNRPERRNALTIELMTELADALDKTSADPQTAGSYPARGGQGILRRT